MEGLFPFFRPVGIYNQDHHSRITEKDKKNFQINICIYSQNTTKQNKILANPTKLFLKLLAVNQKIILTISQIKTKNRLFMRIIQHVERMKYV